MKVALSGIQEEGLDALPANGGWTIRQVAHQIVDGDDRWKIGVKAALGNDGTSFSFDWYRRQTPVAWAEKRAYAKRALDMSLSLLRASGTLSNNCWTSYLIPGAVPSAF